MNRKSQTTHSDVYSHEQDYLEPEPTVFDPGAQIDERQDFRHIAGQVVVATILGLDWHPVPEDKEEDVGADVAFGCPRYMGYDEECWRQVMLFRGGIFTSILLTPSGELSGMEPTFDSTWTGPEEFQEVGIHLVDRRSQQELVSVLRRLTPVLREVMSILARNGEISKTEVRGVLMSMADRTQGVQS